MCVAQQCRESRHLYNDLIQRQNRMTGNSNFQFESNSSISSDYSFFHETIKDLLLWNGCCWWWCFFYLSHSFLFWMEKGRNKGQILEQERKKHSEWMNFEETKPKLILDIGQFEKCFQRIYVYKWVARIHTSVCVYIWINSSTAETHRRRRKRRWKTTIECVDWRRKTQIKAIACRSMRQCIHR